MPQIVRVARAHDGALTLTHAGREITITRAYHLSLREISPVTFRALRYATGIAILAPGQFERMHESILWVAFLESRDVRMAARQIARAS